jgi:thioredoxin reductase (NADPH)
MNRRGFGHPKGKQAGGEMLMNYDTAIIGGGIAGLQTAIQLARSLRRVLVIDDHRGRSVAAKQYRNILGFPEGVSGESLRQAGVKQALQFGAGFIRDQAVSLRQDEQGVFHIGLQTERTRPVTARTVVLATGISDPFPAIPGLEQCLGTTVFICPDCDGYEIVNRRAAVIGKGTHAVAMASALIHFSTDLLVIDHEAKGMEEQDRIRLKEMGVSLVVASVERMEAAIGDLHALLLSTGERLEVSRAFLAFPGARANTQLLQPFSVACNESGHVLVDPRTKETSHRNMWAVGDMVAHSQQVTIAMGDGTQAAIWIHKRLREMDHSGQLTCQYLERRKRRVFSGTT